MTLTDNQLEAIEAYYLKLNDSIIPVATLEAYTDFDAAIYEIATAAGEPTLPAADADEATITTYVEALFNSVIGFTTDAATASLVSVIQAGEFNMVNFMSHAKTDDATDEKFALTAEEQVTSAKAQSLLNNQIEYSRENKGYTNIDTATAFKMITDVAESLTAAKSAVASVIASAASDAAAAVLAADDGADADITAALQAAADAKAAAAVTAADAATADKDLFDAVVAAAADAVAVEAGYTDAADQAAQEATAEQNANATVLTITDADTTTTVVNTEAINNVNLLTNATTDATVTSDAAHLNGATITIDVLNGYLANDDFADTTTVVPLSFAGSAEFSLAANSIVADSSVIDGDSDLVIATWTTSGTTDLDSDTEEAEVLNGVNQITITFNSDAVTAETITAMLKDIKIPDVISAADRSGNSDTESHSQIKVTVADAVGNSDSYTVIADNNSGAMTLATYESDAEVEVANAENYVLDVSTNADFTANGAVTDGMVIAVTGSNSTDGLHFTNETAAIGGANTVRALGDNLLYTADGSTETIIATVSGVDTNTLTITFNDEADSTNMDYVLQQIETDLDSSVLGARTFTTTVVAGDSLESFTGTTVGGAATDAKVATITVVGTFVDAEINGADTGKGNASGDALLWSDINTAIDADQIVELKGNTYIQLDVATPTTDLTQAVADGLLVVPSGANIRFVDGSTNVNLTSVVGINELGNISYGTSDVLFNKNLTLTAAQANGKSGALYSSNIIITEVQDTLAADLSGFSSASGTATATGTLTEDATFTGDLGNLSLTVDGAFTLTVAATVADAKSIVHHENDGATDIITVTGVDGTFEGDLGKLSTTHNSGDVIVEFTADTTLHADAQIDSANLAATVANNTTLTLSTAQATALATATGAITGVDAIGDGNTGGNISLTLVDTNTATEEIEVGAINLTALTAGGIATGATAATAGSVTLNFASNTTLAADLVAGTAAITVANGATLTAEDGDNDAALDITGVTITGAGNVAVDELADDLNADLSDITVTGTRTANFEDDATFIGDLGTFTVSVDDDKTLITTAAIADGVTIAGDATAEGGATTGGSMIITSLGTTEADLSNLTAGAATDAGDTAGTITVEASGDLDDDTVIVSTATINITDSDASANEALTLTLTEAQANGMTIVDAADSDGTLADIGSLTVVGLSSTTDLSNVTLNGALLVNSYSQAITLSSSANLTASTTGTDTIALYDTTLTATARQLDNIIVTGADDGTATGDDDDNNGSTSAGTEVNDTVVSIVGDIAADTSNDSIDLTNIASSANVTFGSGVAIGTGVDLTINASTADEAVLTGAGTVNVADITATTDLTNITTTTFNVAMSATANLTANAEMGAIDAMVLADSINVTVTAAQAEAITSIVGTAAGASSTLTVTNGSDDYNLDLSTIMTGTDATATINMGSGDDTVQGGAGNDTITGGLGSDTYVFAAAASNGTDTVMGFTAGDYDSIDMLSSEVANATNASAYYEGNDWDTSADNGSGAYELVNGLNVIIDAGSTTATGLSAAHIATYLADGTTNAVTLDADNAAQYVVVTDGTDAALALITGDGDESADVTIEEGDVTVIGIFDGISDLTTFSATNFVDFA